MYYEINVSLNGKHFFATADRSIGSTYELKKVLPVIVAKFPESEGYNVSVTYHENVGHGVDIDEVLNQ
jgi:hypothetical protein